MSNRPLRVFLCHGSNDKDTIRRLYAQLNADGLDAWLDEENLLPGQDWKNEILRVIRSSDVIVVVL